MSLLEKLFGCPHKDLSFPQGRAPHTYVCCLICGREFMYDFAKMHATRERNGEDKLAYGIYRQRISNTRIGGSVRSASVGNEGRTRNRLVCIQPVHHLVKRK